jgi:hypothetical protein
MREKPLRFFITKHPCDDLPYVDGVDPDPRTGDARFTFDGPDYSGWYIAEKDILAVVKQMGGMEAHAVPVLPGGPPLWVNAGGPGRYLIIPIEEDLMPDGRPWPDEGERKFEKT